MDLLTKANRSCSAAFRPSFAARYSEYVTGRTVSSAITVDREGNIRRVWTVLSIAISRITASPAQPVASSTHSSGINHGVQPSMKKYPAASTEAPPKASTACSPFSKPAAGCKQRSPPASPLSPPGGHARANKPGPDTPKRCPSCTRRPSSPPAARCRLEPAAAAAADLARAPPARGHDHDRASGRELLRRGSPAGAPWTAAARASPAAAARPLHVHRLLRRRRRARLRARAARDASRPLAEVGPRADAFLVTEYAMRSASRLGRIWTCGRCRLRVEAGVLRQVG